MASVFQRGRVWYVSYTNGLGVRIKTPAKAKTKTEARHLASELEAATASVMAWSHFHATQV